MKRARRARATRALLFPHEESEFFVRFRLRDELVPGLARERLEILHGAGIGGENLEDLTRLHVGQRLLRAQDRQRAVQTARVEFLVEVHASYYAAWPKPTMTKRPRRTGSSSLRSYQWRTPRPACGYCAPWNRSVSR